MHTSMLADVIDDDGVGVAVVGMVGIEVGAAVLEVVYYTIVPFKVKKICDFCL